jgi:hypothetical protein
MARIAGWAVLVLLSLSLVGALIAAHGLIALAIIAFSLILTFLVVWAIGASVCNDWWPFP